MSENSNNNITYDDDWKSVSTSEYATFCDEPNEHQEDEVENKSLERQRRKKEGPKQYLITIQLVICIIIAIAAFVLSSIGGEIYAAANDWYYVNLNKSVIFDVGDTEVNLSKLFSSATPDEI